MAKLPGLKRRPSGCYYLDKTIKGRRYTRSPGTPIRDRAIAEEWYHRVVGELFRATEYRERPKRTFLMACEEFARRATHKSVEDDLQRLAVACELYGSVPLDELWDVDALVARLKGRKKKTVNAYIENVQRVLNLATRWRDDTGLTWLQVAPKLERVKVDDAKPILPLTWDDQRQYLHDLPSHLHRMALFALNTGCRQQEVCGLRWEWMRKSNLGPYFEVPGAVRKNEEPLLVMLNDTARRMVEADQSHDTYVFTYDGHRIERMNNSAWKKWRVRNGLSVGVHALRHTVAHRLRAIGCPLEDRKDIMGHHRGDITERYSAPDLARLKGWLDRIQTDERPVVLREVV